MWLAVSLAVLASSHAAQPENSRRVSHGPAPDRLLSRGVIVDRRPDSQFECSTDLSRRTRHDRGGFRVNVDLDLNDAHHEHNRGRGGGHRGDR